MRNLMIPLALAKKMAQKLFGWSIRAKGFFQWVYQTSEHFNVEEFLHNAEIIHVNIYFLSFTLIFSCKFHIFFEGHKNMMRSLDIF